MNNIINFSIPDYWYLFNLNKNFIFYKNNFSEYFYENCKIDSVFGSFPGCCWNGGRIILGNTYYENMYDIMEFFNINKISIRHTFSNLLLQENQKYDTLGNSICKITEELSNKYNILNGCTVGSKVLFEYIKNTYPTLYLVNTTTLENYDINFINDISKNNITVVPLYFNNKFDLIKQFKYPENIEFICAEDGCLDNCPQRKSHYYVTNLMNNFQPSSSINIGYNCPVRDITNYYYESIYTKQWIITYQDIIDKYLPLGFNKFKISGRAAEERNIINTIENYVNYFIKEKYHNIIRNHLLLDNYNYNKN